MKVKYAFTTSKDPDELNLKVYREALVSTRSVKINKAKQTSGYLKGKQVELQFPLKSVL